MTKADVSKQVTELWRRVGKAEMSQPHPLGYSLDEEVYLLASRLVSQAYEEAARLAQNPYGDEVGALAGDEPKAVGLAIAAAILGLKDALSPAPSTTD